MLVVRSIFSDQSFVRLVYNWGCVSQASVTGRDKQLHPTIYVGCNCLPLAFIFTSGTQVIDWGCILFRSKYLSQESKNAGLVWIKRSCYQHGIISSNQKSAHWLQQICISQRGSQRETCQPIPTGFHACLLSFTPRGFLWTTIASCRGISYRSRVENLHYIVVNILN